MRRQALAAGHRDLTIVNTCAVTAEAARQGRQAIRRAYKEHPGGRLVVTGCAAEIDRAGFAALPGIDRLLPNATKEKDESWPSLDNGAERVPKISAPGFGPEAANQHTRGFVEIQNGCDHRCTFCVIPFGRGASRSVPIAQIIDRVKELVAAGARDVVLTGVDITSYGDDLDDRISLGTLVTRVLRAVPDLPRLRLSSLDCIEADPALRDAIGTEARLMPHLHLSLQSGSDLILKRMKRRHGREDAIAFCTDLRRLRPELVFGADLIAGFPTETEAMFAETMELVEACNVTHVHVFPFSPRPNTPAARMPQVAGDVTRDRAQRLRALAERQLRSHLAGQTGRRLTVLTERNGKGRSEDFTLVRLPDNPPPGQLHSVVISGHDDRSLIAAAEAA
ncbi:tRNA (N(6)-L-threonylcarbamoyladenosine(37)-C(2))-methylthiotransferase MtaB [Hyphomicrobiales bacterium BP6-180914]|uniref:tRNA (N(6)-L-threonylcarbamoyladenosine(37)-C(2))-methylthiotransferase MtaB n=2 Tax=Lichenifustis flavocetrariae TaxID=2949735 RepID=A0AA42CLL4_9HYPH|nr:tRNA (N(6)-L-threonylcarbamoyladenosine(37)-C(2))-methylthiotransferase MtaB [Lichenifustis flavocetrariae]